MISIELSVTELFKSFAEFDIDGIHIDLHNNFHCESINFSDCDNKLSLSFKPINDNGVTNKVDIIFGQILIQNFNLETGDSVGFRTIDTMYRGRFNVTADILAEKSDNGKFYFYINFYGNQAFELFAGEVIANVHLKNIIQN